MMVRDTARLVIGILLVAVGVYDLVARHSYLWGSIVVVGGVLIVAGAVFDKSRRGATSQVPSGE